MHSNHPDAADFEPSLCMDSIARFAATFATMPPEILDRIAQFVDSKSILSLCHAVPYYKYISTAMFDFAHRFPNEKYTPSKFWPDLYFPTLKHLPNHFHEAETIELPVQRIQATEVYSRIISMHGGHVHMPCSISVLNYLDALPKVLSIYAGGEDSCIWVLRGLADANKRIQSCTLDFTDLAFEEHAFGKQLARLQIQSLILRHDDSVDDTLYSIPFEMEDALPFISGLSYLELIVPDDNYESTVFARCLNLKEIAYMQLMSLDDCVGLVECITEQIKGSRIQKVWCKTLTPEEYAWGEGALEAVSSEFLRYGWRTETHDDGDKLCFVHQNS